jgi:hypothetical protein
MVLDGTLKSDAWKDAPWSLDFVDILGDRGRKPWLRTRVKMLWDDDFLYIGAELEEPHLWATLTEHGSVVFQDNDFEVFVDPDGDNHNYFEYEINALGTDWDLQLVKPYRDGGPALDAWDGPVVRKAVFLDGTLNDPSDTDLGWSLELAFPWSAFAQHAKAACPPRPGDQWRMNFSRVQWDLRIVDGVYSKVPDAPEHNWVWSPQGAVDMHRPELWGYVQFAESLEPFRPDPDWTAKCRLMAVYWSQREHRLVHGEFASDLRDLSLNLPGIVLAGGGMDYVAMTKGADGWLEVRSDSRLTRSLRPIGP